MNKVSTIKKHAVIKNHMYEYKINDTNCMIDIHFEMDGKGKLLYRVYVADESGIFQTSSADPSKSKAVSKAIKKYTWMSM